MPHRKKSRTKSKTTAPVNVKVLANLNAQLSELPLDMLLEILQNMEPLNMAQLSYASRSFRTYILDGEPSLLWKAVIEWNPTFPSCPSYLLLPWYVYLAFERTCQPLGFVMSGARAMGVSFSILRQGLCRADYSNNYHRIEENHSPCRLDGFNSTNHAQPNSMVSHNTAANYLDSEILMYIALKTPKDKRVAQLERQRLTKGIMQHVKSFKLREKQAQQERLEAQYKEKAFWDRRVKMWRLNIDSESQ